MIYLLNDVDSELRAVFYYYLHMFNSSDIQIFFRGILLKFVVFSLNTKINFIIRSFFSNQLYFLNCLSLIHLLYFLIFPFIPSISSSFSSYRVFALRV